MMRATPIISFAICVPLCFSLVACGATNPPNELVTARKEYDDAAHGTSAKLKPAELHEAKESLEKAENAYNEYPSAKETVDLSYVAQRKVEWAAALAGAAAAAAQKADLEREAGMTTQQMIDKMGGKLKATEAEITAQKGELAKERENVAHEKQNVETERAARLAAEKKAKDAMDALAQSMAVKQDTRGMVITLSGSVLFATGKADLLAGAQEQLNKVADALKTQAEHHFTVEGHTDSQGTDAVNNELSKKRADSVRDYLIVRGVAADAISSAGKGSTTPIADNKTPEGRAMNRRVEIIVGK